MKRLMTLLVAMIALPLMANAQIRYTPSELDTLVSTIALYPDPLLVHVLGASEHVEDIPRASAFANANRHPVTMDLPTDGYYLGIVENGVVDVQSMPIYHGSVTVAPQSATILACY